MIDRILCVLALAAVCSGAGPLAADTVGVVAADGRLDVSINDAKALSYKYGDELFKPYLEQLYSPAGTPILLDAPADHLHHHALMYAVNVDGVDFWIETEETGRQRSVSVGDVQSSTDDRGVRAGFEQSLDWVNPRTDDVLLKERRAIRLYRSPRTEATFLSWRATLSVPDGKDSVVLTGAHYHGLGMRFVRSMDKGGRFFNAAGAEGRVFRGSERLLKARWCAYTAKADGKDVTVAMFDDPNNPRHPAQWFIMDDPFAYLSATLNLHVEPLTIDAGKALELRYAVVLWDGQIDAERIDQAYGRWVQYRRRGN